MESVTKYSFAKFKGIFVKLSSKLLIAVVLTEKEGGNKPNFGLYRSATLRTSKNFVLVDHCVHASVASVESVALFSLEQNVV